MVSQYILLSYIHLNRIHLLLCKGYLQYKICKVLCSIYRNICIKKKEEEKGLAMSEFSYTDIKKYKPWKRETEYNLNFSLIAGVLQSVSHIFQVAKCNMKGKLKHKQSYVNHESSRTVSKLFGHYTKIPDSTPDPDIFSRGEKIIQSCSI